MDEKYLMEVYYNNGGEQRFGSYQDYYNKVQNDPEYRAKLHYFLSAKKKTDKSYSDWESSIKKKEPTGQNYGYGSNQTQQSNGSKPSQESDGFDEFKWVKEVVAKGKQAAKQAEPPKQEVKSIMFKNQQPDVSKFGTQSFKSENELNNYIEELKKYESDPEAQKQLKDLLNNYESISSDIKSKGAYSFESLGVNTEQPVARVNTATYTLEQINKGNYNPKRVDPNGRWEVKTIVTPESMEYDERTGKTVSRGGETKQVKEWVPSSEFAQKLKEENKEWIKNTKEKIEQQGKILDAQKHVKDMSIFQDMGSQDFYKYDSELYNIEQDYQKGQIGSYEYEQKKSELEAKKAASLIGLENTYINALSKTDPEKSQEYRERYNEIMSDIKNAGFNSWDEYSRYLQQNGYNASNYIDGSDSEKDIFGVIDKSDQEFLRKIRSEAMQAYSSPFLDKMYASTNNVKRYIRDSQPILNDYDQFNNQVKQISDKYKSGNITAEQANAQLQALKNKETELKTRLQQVSDQYGVTQSDLERYSMKEMIGLSQYNNYNQFSGLKEFEQKSLVDQQNRQRWVSENPVLGSLAYALPNAWKHFTDMVLLETGKAAKPLAELVELGDGYGWTDRVFYGLETFQNDRDYLYGYSGQDIDGDGQIDDLPTVAKLIDVTSSGLGSVGAFAIPGSIAAKTFTGAGKLAAAGRFATNFGGSFLMMEAQAYQEALRAGLSQDDASEIATVTATLQALAEQVVNDYSLVRANPFRSAGMISMYRAGLRGQKLMDEGLRYIAKSVKEINKQGLKEAGEEVLGQFGTDIGKDLGNAIYSQNDMVSYASGNGPADASVPFKDAWQIKPYYDNALAGYLTGGFMSAFKSAKPLSRTQMENLSYLGRNWKDVLQIIERTESNGINPGDDTYKQLERDLKGINSVVENLSVMPGFNELTKSNQDMIVSLAYRKKVIEDNMKQLGVELPNVKEELAGIDERINLYLTGKLDYGSNKAVQYNDDALIGMGVRNVMVNPDNSYEIEVRSDLNFDENQKQSISEKAKEYIEKSLKNNDFRLKFLHPNTENYAIQESETGQVPVQPEAAVSEQVEEGAPKTEPQVSTEESKQEEVVPAEQSNRRVDLFPDTLDFAQSIGGSSSSSNLSNYTETNGIGMAEYANPETGLVDVIMSGTSDNDYVGYVRIYENGKPTNRWTSKMSNESGNKDAFKTMISQVQSKLPENHEYTETTNISLDGLRVYGQQLNRGYEIVTDNNGNPVMNSVSLNQASQEGIRNAKTQQEKEDLYTEMNVDTREKFNRIREEVLALMPTARVLWNQANNTVNIQLPVLRKTASAPDVLTRTLDVVNKVEDKIGKSEPINDEDRKQAEDSLYELLNDIDSNPNLSQEQKAQMSLPIENRLQKIQDYELGTRTETRTTTQAVATGTTPKTQAKNERATIPLRTVAEESIDVTYNGRAGKLKIENGNYVFVPNKVGRQQPKPVVVGEAAVTNRDSKFAGVESVNKKGVTTSAQITLPNGAVLGIMDTDLSIDVGIEIAKQEVGPAPQSLFDVVFDEIVTENNVEIPYTKAAPKVEAAKEEEVKEQPKTQQAAESDLGQQLLEGNEYTNKRKNELLKKNKSDSKKRNLISSAAVAIEAIKKIYPDLKVYLHENTEEYELATEAQGIKLSEAGAMIFDGNGNVIGVHVDLSKADGTTTPHELTHAILAKAFGDNPVLFKEFKDRVSKLLSESTNKKLNDFANQEGYEDDVKSEEYLVQLAALLTDNRGKIEPSILQKLMTLINNFVSRITKGNVVPFKSNAKTQALVDFFNSVALTMSTGRDVSGLQSKIRGLQDRFGQAPSESRIIQRETATPEPEAVSQPEIVESREQKNERSISDEAIDNVMSDLNKQLEGAIYFANENGIDINKSPDVNLAKQNIDKLKSDPLSYFKEKYDLRIKLGALKSDVSYLKEIIDDLSSKKEKSINAKQQVNIIDSFFDEIEEIFPNDDIRGGYAVTNENGDYIGRVSMSVINDNTVKIDEVVSKDYGQRTGNGSAIMNMVTEVADNNGITLKLMPNLILDIKAKGFETPAKLQNFYEKFGFVKDSKLATMTRTPNPVVKAKQQIVGERGIENANDKVAQKDLETAKLMASNNRPSTDIKRATGWEMGADGKWRYEYPNVTLKDDLQDENDFRLVVKGYNQSQGISDRFETKPPAIPLSEILNFGELQKAYPYIEDLYFELDDSLQSEAYGQLDIARGLVSLNPKIINQVGIDEVQKVLIHEIQHYIQDQEGFEKGGNVEMFEYEIKNSKDAYKIPGLKLINDYNVEDSIEFGIYDIRNLVDNGVDLMSIYDGKYNKRDYTGNPQALLKAAFRRDQIQKLNPSDVDSAVSKIESYVVYSAAHKDYWNMVGETEARNAAKRSETPYLERLYGQTLESTEDVLRRDQIRKDGGKIFKEMDVISNKRGLARQRMEQQNRENFGELYMKAKEINDNFENIINQLGITKICGL